MNKKNIYIKPTATIFKLASENLLFTPSIQKHQGDGSTPPVPTKGSDAESKESLFDDSWTSDDFFEE